MVKSWSVTATLNSLLADHAARQAQAASANWRGPGTLGLVTHGLTVRALIGIVPSQAETVVLKPTPGSGSEARVVGRIAAPP